MEIFSGSAKLCVAGQHYGVTVTVAWDHNRRYNTHKVKESTLHSLLQWPLVGVIRLEAAFLQYNKLTVWTLLHEKYKSTGAGAKTNTRVTLII